MNKDSYLNELKNKLKANHVEEKDDILAEYEEHFRMKMADGYSEEEIAARLINPMEIALSYAQMNEQKAGRRSALIITGIGLFFADIIVVMVFILLYAWVAVLGGLALGSVGISGILIGNYDISPVISVFPYIGRLTLGISLIALAVLSAVGTVYCSLYITQLGKSYLRWHKKTLSANGLAYPPLSKHPHIKDKIRRRLRSAALLSVVVFAVAFLGSMLLLFALAGFRPFWHHWNWFIH
ncbi:MAG: DUF1700 domain-containing protein [Clostridiales bacterium]|nr:DUF1700 domain-containing protein [Clostridiales bacterium]